MAADGLKEKLLLGLGASSAARSSQLSAMVTDAWGRSAIARVGCRQRPMPPPAHCIGMRCPVGLFRRASIVHHVQQSRSCH